MAKKRPPKIEAKEAESFQLKIMSDSYLSFPQLYIEVFVVGDQSEQKAFAEMFVSAGCRKANTIDDADLVVFTGGPDVNPFYYDESMHESTQVETRRDNDDIKIYTECLEKGIPMFGVCRGAQLLHVMNGGKLAQDVDGHYGDHNMYDKRRNCMVAKVSSVHHQMCLLNKRNGMEIIADTRGTGFMWLNHNTKAENIPWNVEAFWYRDTCCFGVQGHPEYKNYDHFKKWTLEYIQSLIIENPDVRPINNKYRLTPEHIAQREAAWLKAQEEFDAEVLELRQDDALDDDLDDDIPFDVPILEDKTKETI